VVASVMGEVVQAAAGAERPTGDRDDRRDAGCDLRSARAPGHQRERAFARTTASRRRPAGSETMKQEPCPQPQAVCAIVAEQRGER
jgi:hypothetical protein